MKPTTTGSGGERDGDRAIIDKHTRELRDSGVPAAKADQMARDSMRRVDKRLRDEGRR